MKTYIYEDGYSHKSEQLSAKEIKADEKEHGELVFLRTPNGDINVYTERTK